MCYDATSVNPVRHIAPIGDFFRAIVATLTLLLVLGSSTVVSAHGSSGPLKDQRVILIQIHPDHIELGYSVILAPTSSENARSEADADHNGAIDDTEKAAIGETWRASAQRSVRVTIDGSVTTFQFDPAKVSLDGTGVNGALVTIALRTTIDAGSNDAHVIELTDDIALPRGGDLDVQAWARGTARITEPGARDGKAWSQHRHAGAADLRAPVSMHFVGGGKNRSWGRYAFFGGAVICMAAIAWILRQRREGRESIRSIP
jgi:hypothetical protein